MFVRCILHLFIQHEITATAPNMMTPNVHQRAPIQKCGDEVLLLLGCKSTFISSQRKLKVTVTLAPFSLLPKICCYRGRALVYVCVCMHTSFPRFPCLFRSFSPFLFPLSLLLKLLTALFFHVRPQNFPSLSKCTHSHTCRENSLHDADDAPTSLMLCSPFLSALSLSRDLSVTQHTVTSHKLTHTGARELGKKMILLRVRRRV